VNGDWSGRMVYQFERARSNGHYAIERYELGNSHTAAVPGVWRWSSVVSRCLC